MINLTNKKPSLFTFNNGETISGYVVGRRVSKDEIPQYYHKYEIRGSDYDPEKYATIEKGVVVNFCDTFITKTDIDLDTGSNGYKEIKDYDLGDIIS